MANPYLLRRAAAGGTLALAVVVLLLVARGCGGGSGAGAKGTERAAQATPSPTPTPAQLPGGGRQIFPGHRIVAYYGNPADDELGALGIGSPASAARRLLRQAKAYERPRRKVLPALELLVSVANADPGEDGLY